jgi:cell wall-associated NlpC family hydrolase
MTLSEAALRREILKWAGTPYVSGQRYPGRGVDCAGFVFGVLEALYRLPPAADWRSGRVFARSMLERYPHEYAVDGRLEPGDILVTRPDSPHTAHILLVGPDQGSVWHAAPPVVCMSSLSYWSAFPGRGYRLRGKENWV